MRSSPGIRPRGGLLPSPQPNSSIRLMVEAWTVAGDAARCADDLRRFADQGVRRMTLRITGWQQAEQYERLVNDVLPKV